MRLAVAAHRYLLLKGLDHFRMNLFPPQVSVGHEAPRQNCVDRNAMRRPVGRRGPRKLHDRRLAGFIMTTGDLPTGYERVDRRNVDDPAALSARDHRSAD